jgi:hypothetical protein
MEGALIPQALVGSRRRSSMLRKILVTFTLLIAAVLAFAGCAETTALMSKVPDAEAFLARAAAAYGTSTTDADRRGVTPLRRL